MENRRIGCFGVMRVMLKCCPCLKRLWPGRSQSKKATPETMLLCQQAQSLSFEKSSLSVTGIVEGRRPVSVKRSPTSPTRLRPKVYSVLKGTSSICHTPLSDTAVQPKKVVIRKPEPRSALLVSDEAAKRGLAHLKKERCYSEDHGKPEESSPVC